MHYFAYGSNMVFGQMRRLCGRRFEVVGVGILENFAFSPDKRGFANIQPHQGEKVYGILYTVDENCMLALDEFEGHPDIFARTEVEVGDMSGHSYKAWVYMEKPEFFGGDYIRAEYLNRLLHAAEANRLPQEWITFLKSFQTI